MKQNVVATALVAVLMAAFVLVYTAIAPARAEPSMGGATAAQGVVPGVKGYADGQEITFVHTESSSPKIAAILTGMTGSRVLVAPSLAQTPRHLLANVYVFTNGIRGDGPLHFQPDVFDSPPGTAGYRPLRELNLVARKEGQRARVLRSATSVKLAATRGEITIRPTGVVINMPMLTWPGGQR